MMASMMMYRLSTTLMAMTLGVGAVSSAIAADETIEMLTCSIVSSVDCEAYGDCHDVTPMELDLPPLFTIDLVAKEIRPAKGMVPDRTTQFSQMSVVDNALLIAAQDGETAWSAVISRETGRMSVAVSGIDHAIVLFGHCAPKE